MRKRRQEQGEERGGKNKVIEEKGGTGGKIRK